MVGGVDVIEERKEEGRRERDTKREKKRGTKRVFERGGREKRGR